MNRQRLSNIVRVSALGLLVAAGGLSLTGCKSDTPDSVHLNPSPELFTRSKTYDQNMANFALTLDRDLRSAIGDFQRVFLYDRASRMNKSPNPW